MVKTHPNAARTQAALAVSSGACMVQPFVYRLGMHHAADGRSGFHQLCARGYPSCGGAGAAPGRGRRRGLVGPRAADRRHLAQGDREPDRRRRQGGRALVGARARQRLRARRGEPGPERRQAPPARARHRRRARRLRRDPAPPRRRPEGRGAGGPGEPGRQAAPTSGFVSTAGTRISLTGLPTTSARLFGRETELTRLLDAWESGKTNVFSIIAIGGTGKTALLRGFLNALAAKGWAGASHVYAWSAYSQGSGENRNTSAAEFINKALEWFGYAGPAIPERARPRREARRDRRRKSGRCSSSTASSRCRICRSRTRAACAAGASATTACAG